MKVCSTARRRGGPKGGAQTQKKWARRGGGPKGWGRGSRQPESPNVHIREKEERNFRCEREKKERNFGHSSFPLANIQLWRQSSGNARSHCDGFFSMTFTLCRKHRKYVKGMCQLNENSGDTPKSECMRVKRTSRILRAANQKSAMFCREQLRQRNPGHACGESRRSQLKSKESRCWEHLWDIGTS